jgi:hypothetical protein
VGIPYPVTKLNLVTSHPKRVLDISNQCVSLSQDSVRFPLVMHPWGINRFLNGSPKINDI